LEKMEPSATLAEAQGYRVLRVPALSIEPIDDPRWGRFSADLARRRWDWVIFTSTVAARMALRRLGDTNGELGRALRGARIVAIGEATKATLEAAGVPVDLVPTDTTSEGIHAALSDQAMGANRVALLRSAQGAPLLPSAIASLGAEVLDVPLYRLGLPPDEGALRLFFTEVSAGEIDIFAFTSRLTVLNILAEARARGMEEVLRKALANATVAAIGPPTAQTLSSLGIRVDVVSPRAQFSELLRSIQALAEGSP
jgi:uroporphyrinogen-III synthase